MDQTTLGDLEYQVRHRQFDFLRASGLNIDDSDSNDVRTTCPMCSRIAHVYEVPAGLNMPTWECEFCGQKGNAIPNGATYQKEYECVKDFATDLNGNGYPLVRKWFVEQFPNFRKNPMFYLNNSPELISGIAFLNKETSAPEADEVEAPDAEETAVPELKRA